MGGYIVEGGNTLSCEVIISGAKNSVLPILAAAAMQRETTVKNIPFLSDVSNTLGILKKLGIIIKAENNTINTLGSLSTTVIDRELSSKMRSSVLFMGALLGKYGEVTVYRPGGCQLGERPIDLHLWAMKNLGAEIAEKGESIVLKGRLKGCEINLPIVSVGVTENIILAAANAKGTTIIRNSAREPEIDDLIAYLNKCGSRIRREKNTIVVEESGVSMCAEHSVVPDRIETATYCAMAAATGGELHIKNCNPEHLSIILSVLEKTGCIIKKEKDTIYIAAPKKLYSVNKIVTRPYPYFPTDVQPQIMAVLAKAEGSCVINETLFSARNKHISELNKMGADIEMTDNQNFIVTGVKSLKGADVEARDLRGGAALVIAALGAEGVSRIDGACHIERGYEAICAKVEMIGGRIEKV